MTLPALPSLLLPHPPCPAPATSAIHTGTDHRHWRRRASILATTLALHLPGSLYADGLPELGDDAGGELTFQTERQLGRQVMNEIRLREPTYLDDPEIEGYLNRLGRRLVTASPEPGISFHFFALNDRMINAFALLGGYIGVNTGLLLTAQSESEVASVLAHEIAHVTQRHLARGMAEQKRLSVATLAAMAAAILASRANAQVSSAAVASAGAGMTQAQLGFSREFEREADRIGFQILEKAGFDVHGMGDFFGRLQQMTRVYENNAPAYLRTHPLTLERITDMQNRAQTLRYRQVADSTDFHLVRAKLRASQGTPAEAVLEFQRLIREGKYPLAGAAQYGLAVALARQRNWRAAEQALLAARQNLAPTASLNRSASAMLERLAAELRLAQGDTAGGLNLYREATQRHPLDMALLLGRGKALLGAQRLDEGLNFISDRLLQFRQEPRLYQLQAELCAASGKQAAQHRALAEVYALQGQTAEAIEQLELAQRAGDGNFYEQSGIDARLRELRQVRREEMQRK